MKEGTFRVTYTLKVGVIGKYGTIDLADLKGDQHVGGDDDPGTALKVLVMGALSDLRQTVKLELQDRVEKEAAEED